MVVNAKTANYNITQKWFIESLSSNQFILNASNQAYGLKMTLGSTRNCEIQLTGLRESDTSSVDIVSCGDGYYYIKMHTTAWYLCCAGSTQGSNVYWALNPGETDAQKWSLESTTIPGPSNYAYMVANCATCKLHIIRTAASNIELKNLKRVTLNNGGVIGINGGFFNLTKPANMTEEAWNAVKYDVISIAKYNGAYVTPNGQENGGSGNFVIYRSATGTFGTATGTKAASISQVANLSGTGSWAQGGAGMFLGDSSWQDKAKINFTSPTGSHTGLTALVVDAQKGLVYLIVTTETVNYVQFRSAIMSYLGLADGTAASTRFLGEFLDGGGSSTLRARNPENSLQLLYPGTTARILCEVIALKNTN